ncbi:hypothetical protein SHAb15599_00118 [Acinetobacter phage SH-Ab 15599]|nr:hypothetical protein SHAb15599_00118 [Acinetobacter phage SH-Ab 15599]
MMITFALTLVTMIEKTDIPKFAAVIIAAIFSVCAAIILNFINLSVLFYDIFSILETHK